MNVAQRNARIHMQPIINSTRDASNAGALPSFCPSLHHFNSVNIQTLGVMAHTWHTSQDHSKWAIGMPAKPPEPTSDVITAHGWGSHASQGGDSSRVEECGRGTGAQRTGRHASGMKSLRKLLLGMEHLPEQSSKEVVQSRNGVGDNSNTRSSSAQHPNVLVHDLVCITDANRASSQKRRGGGAVCLQHPALWNAFHQLVVELQKCWWQP